MFARPPQIELLDTSQYGVRVNAYEKECLDFHWHFHQEVELLWIDKGQGVLHAGTALHPYKAGQLILLGSNLPHAYGSAANQRDGAKWTVLHFRPSLWGDAFWQLPENKHICELLSRAGCGYVYTGKIAKECAKIMQSIHDQPVRGMPLVRLLNLLEILVNAPNAQQLNLQPISNGNSTVTDTRLLHILDGLEKSFCDPTLTQAQVAQWIHMSPQAFCRFFRRLTGRNFQRYLNELRIAHACANLLSTDQTIAEIAYKAGFNNLSNFNHHFRTFTSYTPSSYRQNKGGLDEAKVATSSR